MQRKRSKVREGKKARKGLAPLALPSRSPLAACNLVLPLKLRTSVAGFTANNHF